MSRCRIQPLLAAAALLLALGGCVPGGSSTFGDAVESAGASSQAPTATSPGRHIVAAGETLSEIAERYGLGLSVVARANAIGPPFPVHVGEVLVLPATGVAAAVRTDTIRKGETLATIAARHGLKLGDIVAANPGVNPDRVRPGQQVRLPGDVAMPAAPPMTAEEVDAVQRASSAKPPSLSGDGFIWPVRGRLVSAFGSKADGTRNDGVNIQAPAGSSVVAAENGVVVYAGDKLPGYGRTLLIRHAGGFTTAYAHAQALLVHVGDRVQRGQKIATVGETGSVRQPQLHFELRAGRTPIDPERYLDADLSRVQVAADKGA